MILRLSKNPSLLGTLSMKRKNLTHISFFDDSIYFFEVFSSNHDDPNKTEQMLTNNYVITTK